MYTVKDIIKDPSTVTNLRATIAASRAPYFLTIFDQALFGIFGTDEVDPEFLEDLQLFVNELLDDPLLGKTPHNDEDFFFPDAAGNRDIDILVSKQRPVVVSTHTSFLALSKCIEALNILDTNQEDSSKLISVFGEASEAVALSKIMSALYFTILEYDMLPKTAEPPSQQELSETRKKAGKLGTNARRQKIQKTIKLLSSMAKKIWDVEPSIPYGILAGVIHFRIFNDTEINSEQYGNVGFRNLKVAFREIAPKTAILRGNPGKPRLLSEDFSNIQSYEVAAENLVDRYIEEIFTKMQVTAS